MYRFLRLAAWLLGSALTTDVIRAATFEITEFLASNSSSIVDENGDREDWIEIRNTTAVAQSLAGWTLSDDAQAPARWTFPATSVAGGGYLIVFASGKDRAVAGANLHTNFRLSDNGEYLGLYPPGAESTAVEFAPEFPPQQANVSFGYNAEGELRFFNPPTPGSANGIGFASRVEDTRFNIDRGFYEAPFDLVITTETPNAEIRYSTNGTPPTATSGLVYSGPIRIAGTTLVRAAAFRAGWLPSNVDTHTYAFAQDVIRQSPTGAPPPGWPSSWGSNTRDYGMDPDVVNDPRYRDTIVNDLKSLPSFFVTMHLPDLFDPLRGIYANPGQDGRTWERPMSLELVYPDGRDGFQVDGGIRIRGGFSRSTGNPKHAFRFFFRQEYGPGRLTFPLFGDGGTDDFDGFDLRTFQNYSWSFQGDGRGTFLRDQFNRDLQLAMGSQGERGDYYHLYLNGQYWGVYNTCERPEASYGATYFGGDATDYDVIKVEAGPYTINATDGTMAGWTNLYSLAKAGVDDVKYRRLLGLNPDGTRNPDYPVYIDPVNLIDYMLVILYGGNLDAPISNFLGNTSPNNFFGLWNRTARDRGFQFFVHDAEHTLLDVNADRTGPYPAGNDSVTKSNPQWLWQRLLASPEFRILAGDRIHRHLQNGGVLTPERARALYERRRNEIDRAVVAESARWGDSKRPSDPFNRNDDWLPAVGANLDFINRRTAIVLQQLRTDGVYPSLTPPQFNQHGGVVNPGFGLLMAASGKPVYFTLDGSDPRAPGGAIAASARAYSQPLSLTESVNVKARTYDVGSWSALADAEFTLAQSFTELFITEVHYNPTAAVDREGDDFEFIELKNVGRASLDLSGVRFTNGIAFRFPNGTRLPAGAFAVLVRDPVAFASRYPGRAIAGTYQGRLSNSGERLTVVHASGAPLFAMDYGTRPPWPQAADGQGFSLVPVQASVNPDPNSPTSWRASSVAGGSPGADDPALNLVAVVISEVLAHTDPPLVDAVELHNPTDSPAPIGSWWISDDRGRPQKFRIPAGTTVPARGYVTFSEFQFNRPTDAPSSFNFSSHGDEVWIFSGDAQGNLTGYSDGFAFGASANGVSFGRHANSAGKVGFPAQVEVTLDLANAGPRLGPVVLNEVHYAQGAGGAEFVELHNVTTEPVPLFDPQSPTNTWRVEGVGYELPPGLILPPGGILVVAGTDPARFRAAYGLPDSVPVVGPFPGSLSDSGERLALERPDAPDILPDGSILVPYVEVDAVEYAVSGAWPTLAASGWSLERRAPATYGDDPASWRASGGEPTPGAGVGANRPPIVNAGSDREFESAVFPVEFVLAGSGADDGLPAQPGRVGFSWTQVTGPGTVAFLDASRSNSAVRLPGTGTYTLRLAADDGERQRSDEVVVRVTRPAEERLLLAAGSTWRYLANGSDQGTSWRAVDFNDAAWPSGRAQFGYGDGDEVTVLPTTTGGTRINTFYFRTRFDVADPTAVSALTVRLMRDDGAMVYLNGALVFRSNMPEGPITAATAASEVVGDANESAFFDQAVDPSLLRPGSNVLAVEVHQQNVSSSDVSFDLRVDGRVLPVNRPPSVNAGPDVQGIAGQPLTLAGIYQDDGLPSPPGVVRFEWRQISGPVPGALEGTNGSVVRAVFPSAGEYTLRFSVDDGAVVVADEAVVRIGGDPYEDWVAHHFTAEERARPEVAGDSADPDGDRQGNRAEFESGTNPRNGASVLGLRVIRVDRTRLWLGVAAVAGRAYSVEERDSVDPAVWRSVARIEAAECTCEVGLGVARQDLAGARFFRVRTP